MSSTKKTPPKQVAHFELRPGPAYRLSWARHRYSLRPHTEQSRAAYPELDNPRGRRVTHFAEVTAQPADTVMLALVHGPNDDNGLPTLQSMAIAIAGTPTVYTTESLATALVFLHPEVCVLTAEAAPAVLAHIQQTDGFGELVTYLKEIDPWNTNVLVTDDNGDNIPNPYTGEGYLYNTVLADAIANVLWPTVAPQAINAVNNVPALEGTRYNVLPGAPFRTATPAPAPRAAATAGPGYDLQLQDPGPNYGISTTLVNFDQDSMTLSLDVTNSYVRHCSAFVSFIGADGTTAMVLTDEGWMALAPGAIAQAITDWTDLDLAPDVTAMLFDSTNRLKFLGTISPEGLFLGIPVSSTSSRFTFTLPTQSGGTVGKIRVLVGSLGLPSQSDWDPTAAVIGLGMTTFMDILVPTISLAAMVGMPDSKKFESLFDKVSFFGPVVATIAKAVWDIIEDPDQWANDLTGLLTYLSDNVLPEILTATEVVAALTALFAAEEVVEAIPFVGWALKALLIEATIEQLAQTVGEVLGSQRVVEFDLTLSMEAQFTLVPVDNSGFPATATTFTVTGQFSDVTGYVYTGAIADPKVPSISFAWTDLPVGGTVSFLVAFYSAQGDLVGKGTSPVIPNVITAGQGALVVPDIAITQLLYPLTPATTYQHQQLLQYTGDTHAWTMTPTPPTQTRKDLGTGIGNNTLAAVSGISLNSDLGILGYAWEASSQNIPLYGQSTPTDQQLNTFQNISSGSTPESAMMFVPAGYATPALPVYLRSAAAIDNGGTTSAVANSFFFLDPNPDRAGGYHLRGITPVTQGGGPSSVFDESTATSWGRFPSPLQPTSLAIHSCGVVVAVNSNLSKLAILSLPPAAVPSDDAPWANVYCGPGHRQGLLSLPQQVAIAPDQTIYVLEAGNMRVQAFSRGGHPVKAFAGLSTPYWFELHTEPGDSHTVTYSAMSVEIKGYIYVLSYEDDGYTPEQFRLDVYTPTGAHLFRQRGLNVGSLTVDLWRNLYTQNFQTLLGPGNRTEPSISEWIPNTPN